LFTLNFFLRGGFSDDSLYGDLGGEVIVDTVEPCDEIDIFDDSEMIDIVSAVSSELCIILRTVQAIAVRKVNSIWIRLYTRSGFVAGT